MISSTPASPAMNTKYACPVHLYETPHFNIARPDFPDSIYQRHLGLLRSSYSVASIFSGLALRPLCLSGLTLTCSSSSLRILSFCICCARLSAGVRPFTAFLDRWRLLPGLCLTGGSPFGFPFGLISTSSSSSTSLTPDNFSAVVSSASSSLNRDFCAYALSSCSSTGL